MNSSYIILDKAVESLSHVRFDEDDDNFMFFANTETNGLQMAAGGSEGGMAETLIIAGTQINEFRNSLILAVAELVTRENKEAGLAIQLQLASFLHQNEGCDCESCRARAELAEIEKRTVNHKHN